MERLAFKDADRAQLSLLSSAEHRCLIFLAQRMPGWVSPDHLTVLGVLSMFGAGLSYWLSARTRIGLVLAAIFLVLNWFGDSLDGTLARVRNRQRPRYGFYVDHVIDSFGVLFLMTGLGFSGYMSPAVAVGLLIIYLMLSIEVYLATYTIGTFHLSHWKFSPTELRVLLIIGNAALFYRPTVRFLGGEFLLFDVGGVVGIVGMTLMLFTAVAQHTAFLYRQERIR